MSNRKMIVELRSTFSRSPWQLQTQTALCMEIPLCAQQSRKYRRCLASDVY